MWNQLPNLAGVSPEEADRRVRHELERARIPIVPGERARGEVATSLTGRLCEIRFRRAWRYWIASGPVPLTVAQDLYADPVGRGDVRAGGHGDGLEPAQVAEYYDEHGLRVYTLAEREEMQLRCDQSPALRDILLPVLEGSRFAEDPSAFSGYVMSYHIDSELGLRIFADAVCAGVAVRPQVATS